MPAMHQINDDDLSTLETTLPQLADGLVSVMDTRLRCKLRQVQRILSDVRWNYGPPSNIDNILVSDDQAS